MYWIKQQKINTFNTFLQGTNGSNSTGIAPDTSVIEN